MTSILDLDVKQVGDIFSLLSKADLRNTSLSCKQLSNVAQPALFENLNLKIANGYYDHSAVYPLLKIFQSKFHLAKGVHRLNVVLGAASPEWLITPRTRDFPRKYVKELRILFKICPNLYSLDISYGLRDVLLFLDASSIVDLTFYPDPAWPATLHPVPTEHLGASNYPLQTSFFEPLQKYGGFRSLDIVVPHGAPLNHHQFKYQLELVSLTLCHSFVKAEALAALFKVAPQLRVFRYDVLGDATASGCSQLPEADRSPVLYAGELGSALQHKIHSLRELRISVDWYPQPVRQHDKIRFRNGTSVSGVAGYLGSLEDFVHLQRIQVPLFLLMDFAQHKTSFLRRLLPWSIQCLHLVDDLASEDKPPWTPSTIDEHITDLLENREYDTPHLSSIIFEVRSAFPTWLRQKIQTDEVLGLLNQRVVNRSLGDRVDGEWEPFSYKALKTRWDNHMQVLAQAASSAGWEAYTIDVVEGEDDYMRVEILPSSAGVCGLL
ncbi:MAG: hypothetical protein M1821_004511 [Bathelium mastoideum]|nr:MAG: hypothetical protein M1821_004511 [Bathelium mastoideum]